MGKRIPYKKRTAASRQKKTASLKEMGLV